MRSLFLPNVLDNFYCNNKYLFNVSSYDVQIHYTESIVKYTPTHLSFAISGLVDTGIYDKSVWGYN